MAWFDLPAAHSDPQAPDRSGPVVTVVGILMADVLGSRRSNLVFEVADHFASGQPARGRPRHRQEGRQPRPGKLGAANRTEAVARARQLNLIP